MHAAVKPILSFCMLLTFLYGTAVHAGEQKCNASRLRENLAKSDGKWLVEDDPLPPQKRITVGARYQACTSRCESPFQPIRRLSIAGDKIWVAPFGSDYMPAKLRVVGDRLNLDRITFMQPLPAMWQSMIIQRYAKPGVRFTLSAPDGECGAGALVLTVDGTAAAEPFPTEQWQFKRTNSNWWH